MQVVEGCAEARKTKDAGQARRLLALAAVYDGSSRTEAAEIGGVTLQIVRDWVLKFNSRGPDGLIDGKAPGKPSRLNDSQRAALMAIVESGPTPAIHDVARWQLVDLCRWVLEEFRVVISTQTMSRELRAMRWQGRRPDAATLQQPRHEPPPGRNLECDHAGGSRALLVDQAGWRLSDKLIEPPNITSSRCRPNAPNSIRRDHPAIHARLHDVIYDGRMTTITMAGS